MTRYQQIQEIRQQRLIADNILGQIPLGFVNNSELLFGLRPKDSPKVIEVIGQPGSGKSNLFRVAIDGIIKNTNATIVIVDTKGTEKYLYHYMNELLNKNQYLFLSPENYRDNPLYRPHPSIIRDNWYRMICGYLLPSLGLRYESGNALIAAAFKAKQALPSDVDPAIFDLYKCLKEQRPKNYTERIRGDYVERALYRVEMSIINLSNVLGCRGGINLEEYRKKRVVLLDLSKADEFSRNLLIETFMAKIYHYQMSINTDNEASWFILIDEASNVYSENKIDMYAGISPLESILRMSRSTGIWFALASQSYSSLSHGARTMAGCKILFKTDPTELRYLGGAMNLSENDIKVVDSLETGEALVKLESRPGTPVFKITVPEFRIRNGPITENIFEPVHEKYDCQPIPEEERIRIINQILGEKEKPKPMTEIKREVAMNDNKKIHEFLINISEKPFLQFTERLSDLKFGESIAEADRIKKLLIDQDYVVEYKIKLKKGRGSKASYLEIAPAGKDYLIGNGYKPVRIIEGKSGYLHSLIVIKLIKPFYESKYLLEIEGKNKGFDCDLAVCDDRKKLVAVEVSYTTNAADEIRNIRRNINAGYEKVQIIVVAISKEGKSIVEDEGRAIIKKQAFTEAFSKDLDEPFYSKVQVLTLKEFRDLA